MQPDVATGPGGLPPTGCGMGRMLVLHALEGRGVMSRMDLTMAELHAADAGFSVEDTQPRVSLFQRMRIRVTE